MSVYFFNNNNFIILYDNKSKLYHLIINEALKHFHFSKELDM